ncbi:MAG: pilus assembly protein TadG-related protein [Pseudomonadota bacterium]
MMAGIVGSIGRAIAGRQTRGKNCLNVSGLIVKTILTWSKTPSCNAQKKGTLGAEALSDKSMFADFKRDCRGKVVIIFALILIPMLAVVGFAVDFQQTVKRKGKVQLVLDSAVLAAARVKQTGASDDVVKLSVQEYFDAQIVGLGGLECDPATVVIVPNSEEIDANMRCRQDTTLMKVVGQEEMSFKVVSGSEYGIEKIDVAFMFDVSGSMNSNSRLTNLKVAAQEAVDTLLPAGASQELIDNTRLAMVSYNAMVNAGDYFEAVTGVTPTRTYTHVIEPDYTEDDLTSGDVYDDFLIGLYDTDTGQLIAEIGDGAVIEVQTWQDDDLTIAVTLAPSHELYDEVESMRMQLSGTEYKNKTENVEPYALYGDGGSLKKMSGQAWDMGEFQLRLRAYSGNNLGGSKEFDETFNFTLVLANDLEPETKTYTLTSKCVWERDGTEKFTDAAPGANAYLAYQQAWFVEKDWQNDGGDWFVGHPNRPYDGKYDGNECRNIEPLGLTNNRTELSSYISSLTAGGYTAGHLGVGWTWYLVAEDWNTVFTGDEAPLAYSEPDSAKVVILMTDGAFNAEIFPGQGSSDEQARALCDNMHLRDIKVYAVALNAPSAGKEVLKYCASSDDFYFEPENGTQLTDAYKQIATSISDLRISK